MLSSLGMAPCEGTASVDPDATTHMLLLSGVFYGGVPVLVQAAFAAQKRKGILLKMVVRSPSEEVREIVMACIQ